MAGRFSPIASQGSRFAELGSMLMAVDVDLAGLDRGLSQARAKTAGATTDMGRNLDRFSRGSRFAFGNASHQVQDFIVQIASGQGALRSFAQQAPQFASAFGPVGAAIGTVVALAGGLGAAFLGAGQDASTASADIDTLEEALRRLVRSGDEAAKTSHALAAGYAEAGSEIRQALEAQAGADVQLAREALGGPREELADVLTGVDILFRSRRAIGEFTDEQQVAVTSLFEQLSKLQVGTNDFMAELERLAAGIGPRAAEALLELGEQGRAAATRLLEAEQTLARAEAARGRLQRLREQGIGPETGGRLGALAEQLERETDAQQQAVKERERQLEGLRSKIRALQAQMEAGLKLPIDREEAAQIKDLATAAEAFGLSIQGLKEADPELRQIAQDYVEVAAGVRRVAEENERAALAVKELNEALAREAEETRKENEEFADWQRRQRAEDRRPGEQRQRQVEAGGRLPSDIDAANLAASELSSTLTDIDGITFDGLLTSLTSIGTRIAEMVLEALIFRAIMSSVGGGAGGGLAPIFSGAATGAARHGAVFAGGRLTTAQHGAVFSRGQKALMTGAVSGAALLEGAGDEAIMPLKTTRSGDLGVRVEGVGGGTTNITLSAQRIDPGTISWLMNTMGRRVPGLTVNAQKRGMLPRQGAPF